METEINMAPVTGSIRKFKIFESSQQVMVVGSDKKQEQWHILKFDKYTDMEAVGKKLEDIMIEEIKTFTMEEYVRYMAKHTAIKKSKSDIHSQSIGLSKNESVSVQNFKEIVPKAYGIMGFVKFLKGYYLLMISKKQKVAKIGFHDIYQIKDMKMIPLFKWASKMRYEDETKYQ